MAATCALLGSVSHDLSEPGAALAQASSAGKFAEMAGHRSLETWSHCTCAMIHSWWGTPKRVLDQVDRARKPYGISAVRLSGLAARAYAELGQKDLALRAITCAAEGRGRSSGGQELAEFGATFSFSVARQHYYNSMAYADLGAWSRALSEAVETIELYSPVQSHSWPATRTLSEINLARSLLHLEGPDAALDGLRAVLTIPVDQRIPQVHAAMGKLKDDIDELGCRNPTSGELVDAIREFKSKPSGVE